MTTTKNRICKKCDRSDTETLFTNKAKYCKDCVRKCNRVSANKRGIKEKFIPIFSETEKQCVTCKKVKHIDNFSPSKRGRLFKSAYCKPCASQYQRQYLSKEERRLKTQKYRDNNREWWRTLHRINQFNRKNKVKAVSDGTVTKAFIETIYNEQICHYCKQTIPRSARTVEHKEPLNKGGKHSANNIVMSCFLCNSTKRDMTENEFNTYLNENKSTN